MFYNGKIKKVLEPEAARACRPPKSRTRTPSPSSLLPSHPFPSPGGRQALAASGSSPSPGGRQALAASGITAFTLIEMLVVIAIIAIMAGMMVGVSKYANRAMKESSAHSEVERMANCLQDYFVNNGCFPNSLTEITNNLSSSFDFNTNNIPLDPWDNEYVYTNSSLSYTLYSCGPDGTNSNDDISPGK